jgi:uncharacterized protein (DUF885 family)
MRVSALAWCLPLVALTLAACVAQAPTDRAGGFRSFLDEQWKYWMEQYPEAATAVGHPGRDSRWTDYSAAAIEARKTALADALRHLRAFDRAALSADDQLNYDLYLEMLESAERGLAFGNDALPLRGVIPHNLLMPVNQIEGVQQDIPRTISLMPTATVADFEAIVARLEGIPRLVDETIELMKQGIAAGATPPRVTFRGVPAQVAGQIVEDPAKSPLLAAFATYPAAVPRADRDRLTQAAHAAYVRFVKPAFQRFHTFLVGTYEPACRETTAASALPRGAELYAYNVKWHTTLDRTPQEIHAIGQAEVARIRAAMDEVIAQVRFTKGFEAFKTFLRTDPRFFHRDAGALVNAYRDIAKRADPALARLFKTLPRTPYGVREMAAEIAPSQTTAYYEPGALTAGRPGYMFANTYKLDARPIWEMEALTLHEAVPGHHLQIALAQEMADVPAFRQHTSYTAFVEGWALYAESLGAEMGFYADPYARFGQLTYDMWRAVRLVVDTGLHAMGWTRQQAIDFFLANAAKTLQDVTVEVDRYIVWPGQALGYKMGQLEIQALRAAAERDLGPRFDVRTFHDVVLSQGAVPLDVLARRVRAWVQSVN